MKQNQRNSLHQPSDPEKERTIALLKRELNAVLRAGFQDPDLEGLDLVRIELRGATLTAWARAGAPLPRVSLALARAHSFIHQQLFGAVYLKRIPELRFRLLAKPLPAHFSQQKAFPP